MGNINKAGNADSVAVQAAADSSHKLGKLGFLAAFSLRGTLLAWSAPTELGFDQLTACTKCV